MTSHRNTPSEPIPHGVTAVLPFATTEELRDRWRALMGPLGFSETLLWCIFVEDQRLLRPALIQLELEGPPDPDLADLFMLRIAEAVEHSDVEGVALLLSRPGSDRISPWDRGWVRLLSSAAQVAGVRIEPIFRANAVDLVEVPNSPTVRESVA